MLARAILLIALLFPIGAAAQSRCEGPFTWGYCPPAQRDQRERSTEERGTEQKPIVVKVISPKPSEDQKKRDDTKEKTDKELSEYTFGLFLATLALDALTAGLVIVGFCAIRRGEQSSKKIERAYIMGGGIRQFIDTPVAGQQNMFQRTMLNNWEFRIANHGKTMGQLVSPVEWDFCDLSAVSALPKNPHYTYSRPFNDKVLPGTADRPLFPTPILGNYPNPVVYGRYWYLDIWGDKRETRFILEIRANDPIPNQIVAPDEYRLTT